MDQLESKQERTDKFKAYEAKLRAERRARKRAAGGQGEEEEEEEAERKDQKEAKTTAVEDKQEQRPGGLCGWGSGLWSEWRGQCLLCGRRRGLSACRMGERDRTSV